VGRALHRAEHHDPPANLLFDLSVQAIRERNAGNVFLTLEGGQVALQLGRLPNLQPVLLLEGPIWKARRRPVNAGIKLAPGAAIAIRWYWHQQQVTRI